MKSTASGNYQSIVVKRNDDASHALKIRPKYVLIKRSPVLSHPAHGSLSTTDLPTSARNNCTTVPNRGRNRHKANIKAFMCNINNKTGNSILTRDSKVGNNVKICTAVMLGQVCSYGDMCKYSHDLKGMLECREEDIKEIECGCPHYNLRGKCPYGISCRVGLCHLNMVTGVNITKDIPNPSQTLNILSKDVHARLRKKKYEFYCKRHFKHNSRKEHNKKIYFKKDKINDQGTSETDEMKIFNDEKKNVTTATPDACISLVGNELLDMSSIPSKTRKLIDFSNKVYVAPLTTVGNLPFRRILKRYGADITCGEMVMAHNLLEGKSGELALLKRHPEEDLFGVQMAAGYVDLFTRASEVIERECIVDFVDLNLGCPINVICDRGAGAKLMMRENKLKEILMEMSQTLSCPMTIKMRTGWDENKPFAHKLVPKIQSWGIDGISAIMVHGRSRLQRFTKQANWDYIQQVAQSQNQNLPCIPVIGNGDIFSYVDYDEQIGREGLTETAMIGRGALIKPWLPTEIKERRHWDISATERLDILKEFVKFGLEHWGSDQEGINTTRRFMLEWLSFLYRYVPVGILEVLPQSMNKRPPMYMCGRSDLETLMLSNNCADWIKISEMVLGPIPDGFQFQPKHKANSFL